MREPVGGARRERVLFVTRRFPPTIGGQELYAANVYRALRASHDVTVVALRRPHTMHLLWFLPWAAARVLFATATRRVDRVVFGDAVVYAALGWFVYSTHVQRDVLTLGLDVSYANPLYRAVLRRGLRRADRVTALSRAGVEPLGRLGVPAREVVIVAPGIDPPKHDVDRAEARRHVLDGLGVTPDALVVALVGRLVARKGTAWFVDAVVPNLPDGVACIIAGAGPEQQAVHDAVERNRLQSRVVLLGAVDDESRDLLYAATDVVVIPNVPVEGDMEGFGLVAIEAMFAGSLVLAADLEGLRDSVLDDVTGYTCPPRSATCFVDRITALAANPVKRADDAARFASAARDRFSYERMAVGLAGVLTGPRRGDR